MKSSRRVLFAGLFHETNTFVETHTPESDFVSVRAKPMLNCLGDSSPMGGALAAARSFSWEIIPALDMRAMPSGMASDAVVEIFWEGLEAAFRQALVSGLDALFFVLHGAMVTESHADVEGELLARLRKLPGAECLPVFGVFDLHANFTEAMARHADCLVAYRENPHTDAREAAVRAVGLLEGALSTGALPRTFWRHPPIVWPPTGTGTAAEPMRSLLALAREMESRNPDFVCVNVIAGFSFADTPEAGVSFTVCTVGAESPAQAALDELSALAWQLREMGNVLEEPAEEVVARALEFPVVGLTVIAEPSDNIGGGAPGDGTGLLRAFLKYGVQGAALALLDPDAVALIRNCVGAAPVGGQRLRIAVGGRGSKLDAGPLELEFEVLSLSEGCFELADKNSHLASASGDFFEMGPCAVVRHEGVVLLLTSRATPPMDLAQWTSQGLDPAGFTFIGVKAAVAHRGAYEPIATRLLWADTPGPCASRLAVLPFRKIRRPVFPLDTISEPFLGALRVL